MMSSAVVRWNLFVSPLLIRASPRRPRLLCGLHDLGTERNIHNIPTSSVRCSIAWKNKESLYSSTLGSERTLMCRRNGSSCFAYTSIRTYAKGKDRKKSDKGKSKKVEVNDEELAEIVDVEKIRNQMSQAVEVLKEEYIKHLSLRSATGSIESLRIKLDGKEYVLQELAQIVRKNPKTIVINMATFPQAIPAALQALQQSGMNLNPQQDSTTIFVPVPPVTKEHRENLVKNSKALFVKCKDHIRDVQNKFVKNVKKDQNLSADVAFSTHQQIMALAAEYTTQAEKIMEVKQNELLGKD